MTFQWHNTNGWCNYSPEINQMLVDAKNAGSPSIEINIPNLGPYIINLSEMRQVQKHNSHRWRRMRYLEPGVQERYTSDPVPQLQPARPKQAPQSNHVYIEADYPCPTVVRDGILYAVVPDPNGSNDLMMARVYQLEDSHPTHPGAHAVRWGVKWYKMVDLGEYGGPQPSHLQTNVNTDPQQTTRRQPDGFSHHPATGLGGGGGGGGSPYGGGGGYGGGGPTDQPRAYAASGVYGSNAGYGYGPGASGVGGHRGGYPESGEGGPGRGGAPSPYAFGGGSGEYARDPGAPHYARTNPNAYSNVSPGERPSPHHGHPGQGQPDQGFGMAPRDSYATRGGGVATGGADYMGSRDGYGGVPPRAGDGFGFAPSRDPRGAPPNHEGVGGGAFDMRDMRDALPTDPRGAPGPYRATPVDPTATSRDPFANFAPGRASPGPAHHGTGPLPAHGQPHNGSSPSPFGTNGQPAAWASPHGSQRGGVASPTATNGSSPDPFALGATAAASAAHNPLGSNPHMDQPLHRHPSGPLEPSRAVPGQGFGGAPTPQQHTEFGHITTPQPAQDLPQRQPPTQEAIFEATPQTYYGVPVRSGSAQGADRFSPAGTQRMADSQHQRPAMPAESPQLQASAFARPNFPDLGATPPQVYQTPNPQRENFARLPLHPTQPYNMAASPYEDYGATPPTAASPATRPTFSPVPAQAPLPSRASEDDWGDIDESAIGDTARDLFVKQTVGNP